MSLGAGVLKLVEPGNALAQEVSMPTLQAATTRHRHTEPLSGILTNQYLLHPNEEREGWAGWKIASKQLVSETASKTAFAKGCKQTNASKGHRGPLLKAWDHPKPHETKNHLPVLTQG